MPDNDKIYVPAAPGEVITAEAWNEVQSSIYDDIRETSQAAAEGITEVERSGDSQKLGGKTTDELTEALIDRILDQLREHRGYLKVFKVLTVGDAEIIEHGFGDCPVVDVYQLDYFRVVCSEDDAVRPAWATFYLYHSSEKKIRYPAAADGSYSKGILEIEPKDPPVYKVPFHAMLDKYRVEYTSTSSLGDLEAEFWQAFFAAPNDEFDDEQYCHSPWFHRCCREEKSVAKLKQSGDWDELWLQFRPRKTINYPWSLPKPQEDRVFGPIDGGLPTPAPTQIEVAQLDLDQVAVTLLAKPVYPDAMLEGTTDPKGGVLREQPGDAVEDAVEDELKVGGLREQFGDAVEDELKVMVILKC